MIIVEKPEVTVWQHIIFFLLGLGVTFVVTGMSGYLFFVIYFPWIAIGEWIQPTTGPGGHAMVSLSTLCSIAIGFFVYSFLAGIGIRKYWYWRKMQ